MLSVRGLCKSFDGNSVLNNVDVNIRPGEFVALLGPNGSGKSTIIKCLAGLCGPDSGELELDGEPVRNVGSDPRVGFLHQDLGIVDGLTVLDNLRLGVPPLFAAGRLLSRRQERLAAAESLASVDLIVPLGVKASLLSAGQKVLLAMARLLDMGAQYLVVDEATATLPPDESRRFLDILRREVANGAGVIFVSHKLAEVTYAADRAVVLVDGAIVEEKTVAPGDAARFATLMMPKRSQQATERANGTSYRKRAATRPLVRMQDVSTKKHNSLNLEIGRGEVVGVAGHVGSGLHEIGYLAHGMMEAEGGGLSRAEGIRSALVPPLRECHGNFSDLSSGENLMISSLGRVTRKGGIVISPDMERAIIAEMIQRLGVTPANPKISQRVLSGGNQQKIIFGRALLTEADLYVLCEPTRGVDVATRAEIYRLIRVVKSQGCGILLISSDMADLVAVCDRIGVLSEGNLAPPRPIDQVSLDEISHGV